MNLEIAHIVTPEGVATAFALGSPPHAEDWKPVGNSAGSPSASATRGGR